MKVTKSMATVPVSDASRGRSFYENTLGLEPAMVDEETSSVIYKTGDDYMLVYQTDAKSGDATVASLWVEDLDATVKKLRDDGFEFLEFDFPDIKWDNGVASFESAAMGQMRSAWFQDPDGNVVALGEGRFPE